MEKLTGKKKVAVFISGRGSNLKSLLKFTSKKNSSTKIILVISSNPNAIGLKYAKKYKIKNYRIKFSKKSSFENQSLKLLKKNKISSYNIDSELLLANIQNLSRESLLINLDQIIKKKKILWL